MADDQASRDMFTNVVKVATVEKGVVGGGSHGR
jgi:hypothetical protein